MSDEPFETVAIAYRAPQIAVMLSMFEWYGIPAYAKNAGHSGVDCPITLALGGIPILVHRDHADDARALLIEAAERIEQEPAAPQPLAYRLTKLLAIPALMLLSFIPPPRLSATIVGR
ncbi:hypothetical protein [Sphingomonas sp.]|uniref:hypothetical protein n=1 Tax=Sphingomonas sp. TaxID=28214 RepID=UPI001B0E9851|nr:hypothetical protein [Sphingomonas sp.]MBO9712427.1 hypothetical protein [Sphingomonas sp.]